jgi:hypothetical protein
MTVQVWPPVDKTEGEVLNEEDLRRGSPLLMLIDTKGVR